MNPLPKQLPAVQTIVMRTLIRSWRTRYHLKISEIRTKSHRKITWASLFQLQQKGLVQFNPMGADWGVPCWHGRPIVRVAMDGRVIPVRGRYNEWQAERARRFPAQHRDEQRTAAVA